MGKKRRTYRRDALGSVEHDMLSEISTGDFLVGMLLSGRSTRRMFAIARERAARRQAERRAVSRLKDRGFLEIDGDTLQLTAKGSAALERAIARLRSGISDKQQVWDGKWRVVAFDIPESAR